MGAGSLENELGMRGREDRLVFVLLFLFWLLLNGKVTVEIILVGAAVSAALTAVQHPGHRPYPDPWEETSSGKIDLVSAWDKG